MPIGSFGRVRLLTVLVFAAVALTLTGCFQTAGDAIQPTPVNLSAIATATNTLAPVTPTPFVTALPTTGFATPTDSPTDSGPTATPPDVSVPTQEDTAEPPSLTPTVELPTNTAESSSGGLETPIPAGSGQTNLVAPTGEPPTATSAPTSSGTSGLLATPTALATEGPCVHTVQPNEWMSLIARNYNVSLEALEAANTQYNPNTLAPGDVLVIPNCANGTVMPTSLPTATGGAAVGPTAQTTATTYTVVAGDTLFGLAAKYGTTVDAIKQANGLTSDALSIGQQLIIP